jgi:hypothetical protein
MNTEVHCVVYLYTLVLINVQNMEIIKIQRNLNKKIIYYNIVFPHAKLL